MSVLKIKSQDLLDVSKEVENHLLFIKNALHEPKPLPPAKNERFFADTIKSSTGEIEIIELLIRKNRYLKEDEKRKIEELQAEIREDLTSVKLIFLEHGISMFHEFEEQRFFRAAIVCKDAQLIQLLFRSGCSVSGSEYFLHKAIQNSNINFVRSLLNLNYPANIRAFGRRPVHEAAISKNTEILKLLIEHGADLDEPDEDGLHPMHHAVRTGTIIDNIDLLDMFNSNGISVDVREENTGKTALQIAVSRRNAELARHLVFNEMASMDVCDNGGNSILHCLFTDLQFTFIGKSGSEVRHKYNANKAEEIKAKKLLIWILSEGADMLCQNAQKETPFHIACRSHLLRTVRIFIDRLRNLEMVKNGNKVMQHLLFGIYNMYKWNFPGSEILDTIDVVKLLLKRGLAIDWGDVHFKPFHFTLSDIRCKIVIDALLPHFTAANVREGRSTVLHLLLNTKHGNNLESSSDYANLVKKLISKGADVNGSDCQQMTALHYAAKYKYKRVMDILLRHGASARATDSNSRNALHMLSEQVAVGYNCREPKMVEALVRHGCPVNALNVRGYAPLHLACLAGRPDIVVALIARGAAVEYRDTTVEQPIILAAQAGCPEVVRVIVEAGARVNERDESGRTALHYAATDWTRDKAIALLLSYAADTEIRDYEDGWTPLHEAFRHRNRKVVERLVKYGADFNAIDKSGKTPVAYSRETVTPWLICHLVKMKTAGLKVSPDYDPIIDSHRYQFLIQNCKQELSLLGTVRGDCLSLLEFLRMDVEDAYRYCDKENFDELLFSKRIELKFTLYVGALQSKYYRLMAVRKVVEPAKEAFSKTVNSRLPENCLERILLFMGSSHVVDFLRDYQKDNATESNNDNLAKQPLPNEGNLKNNRKRKLPMDNINNINKIRENIIK